MNADKKNVVLTGASRGIGHATVKKFSETGHTVEHTHTVLCKTFSFY